MEYNKEKKYPLDKQPADTYDDGDIPQEEMGRVVIVEKSTNSNQ